MARRKDVISTTVLSGMLRVLESANVSLGGILEVLSLLKLEFLLRRELCVAAAAHRVGLFSTDP